MGVLLHLEAADRLGLGCRRPPARLAIASCGNAALAAATLAAAVGPAARRLRPAVRPIRWVVDRLEQLGAQRRRVPPPGRRSAGRSVHPPLPRGRRRRRRAVQRPGPGRRAVPRRRAHDRLGAGGAARRRRRSIGSSSRSAAGRWPPPSATRCATRGSRHRRGSTPCRWRAARRSRGRGPARERVGLRPGGAPLDGVHAPVGRASRRRRPPASSTTRPTTGWASSTPSPAPAVRPVVASEDDVLGGERPRSARDVDPGRSHRFRRPRRTARVASTRR